MDFRSKFDSSTAQVSGGPNPAIEDLSPQRGSISIPLGQAVAHFNIFIQDDQAQINTLTSNQQN